MIIWGPLPDKIEQKFKKELNPYTLGNILVIVWTCQDGHAYFRVDAMTILVGSDDDQYVRKGVRVQLLFEFLLYLIRKWFPDDHGAQPGVSSVCRSGP